MVVFYITEGGHRLAETIADRYPEAIVSRFSAAKTKTHWKKGTCLIFIMASGIVVRSIAPLLRDKRTDPAVLVADEKGTHVISLVSGHLGGANELARQIALLTGGQAVVTTASDVNDLPAIDLWAEEHGFVVENREKLSKAGTKLVNKGSLKVFSDVPIPLPASFARESTPDDADILITDLVPHKERIRPNVLILRPRDLIAGVGCNSGTAAGEIEDAVRRTLDEASLSFLSLAAVATIDRKAREPGLIDFCRNHDLPIIAYSAEELNLVPGVTPSPAARKATGAQAVADPAAILASHQGILLIGKQRIGNVTVAISQKATAGIGLKMTQADDRLSKKGKLFVVGTGPGRDDYLTPRASKVIKDADAIVGYGRYLDLARHLVTGKEIVSTGMAQEIDRCRRAIELAAEGKQVAMISGGDPGIYAMAGLVLELIRKEWAASFSPEDIEIVPGISALNACAARLGAPLMHDFAAISLSDRLTSWQTIETRIDAAAGADFVIALYNPKSRGRRTHIEKACSIILKYRSADTPVGIVKAAMREDEVITVADLGHMPFHIIDMQTTVIIGNSRTESWKGLMITPRGYEQKKSW
jgi:cobalt-precorrin 5A hydrolase / precorrin-3B C17-methyltransferase